MKIVMISILLLVSPILNIILFRFFISRYIGYALKIVHLIIMVISVVLILEKVEFAAVLFLCNLAALIILMTTEIAYHKLLDYSISPIIFQLTNAEVISNVLVTRKNLYALTTKGYVVVEMVDEDAEDYEVHQNIQEFSENEQKYLAKLKKKRDKKIKRFSK